MKEAYGQTLEFFAAYPHAQTAVAIAGLLFIAFIANWVTKQIALRALKKVIGKKLSPSNQETMNLPVASRLANVVPAIVIGSGIAAVPGLPETAVKVVQNLSFAFIALTIAIAVGHLLDYVNVLYARRPGAQNRPIKGYLQLAKLIIYLVATVLIVSALIDKNPLILLSGLGAMAAVLMLVFQDTILSLVASVQIGSTGSVRVGDWITMPQMNADGTVIDIALHTVTVQNFDNTLTIFPTKHLVSESFTNWRGMSESGGRRIVRSIDIDQTSVRFLTKEEIERLRGLAILNDYLDEKLSEIGEWNQHLKEEGRSPINYRAVTNLGTFRAYMQSYIDNHPKVHKGMSAMARQLQPTPTGIPMQVYCFSNDIAWANYEDIQGSIFEHLLAILPEFGLRVVQQPTGNDVQNIAKALAQASSND